MAQRKIHGRRNFFAYGGVRFNLLADGFNSGVRAQETVGQRLVFAQKTQQKVFGFDVGASKLAGFVSCKEDDSARFFGITFKHNFRRLSSLSTVPAGGGEGIPPA